MKKYIIAAMLVFALSLGGIITAGLWVNGMENEIKIEEEVLYGDSALANGVEISSRTSTHYHNLLWQTDYTVGMEWDSKSEFTFEPKGQIDSDIYDDYALSDDFNQYIIDEKINTVTGHILKSCTDGAYMTLSSIDFRTKYSNGVFDTKGIYFIPYQKAPDKDVGKTANFHAASIFYPLTESTETMGIEESEDGKNLIIVTNEQKKIYFSLIRKADGKLLQKTPLHLNKTPENEYVYTFLKRRNALMIVFPFSEFILMTEKDGKYSIEFKGDFGKDIYFSGQNADMDYDGKTLAVVTSGNEKKFHDTLFIFEEGKLKFLGKYTHSADRHENEEKNRVNNSRDRKPLKVNLPG